MVTIGMNYEVLEDKGPVFERAFAQVVKAMEEGAGHSKTDLYRNVSSPQTYLIVSEWNDEAAFKAFIASDAFAKVTNWGKEQILAARPSHTVYHT